jgi:hypothetical protein
LLVIAAIVIGFVGRSSGNDDNSSSRDPSPSGVEPVPQTGDPAEDAHNLADWLRANSG